jgi:hypothetical protein
MLFTLLAIFLLGNPIIRLAGGSIDIVYVTDKGTQKINKPPGFSEGFSFYCLTHDIRYYGSVLKAISVTWLLYAAC